MAFYAENGHAEWKPTAEFLRFMMNLIKVVNVKTAHIGARKRDSSKNPIMSLSDDKLTTLQSYADFFRAWKESGKRGLTSPTFQAAQLMCRSLKSAAEYLLSSQGYHFVLLGHLQSDIIEGRFGRYRQMSGANFFISVKQVLESERRIKIVSSLKHSKMTVDDLSPAPEFVSPSLAELSPKDAAFIDQCQLDGRFPELDPNELNAIYHCGGYIGRHVSQHVVCDDCLAAIVSPVPPPSLECNDSSSAFTMSVSRGGLVAPSDNLFVLCVSGYRLFCVLKLQECWNEFLLCDKPSSVFFTLVSEHFSECLVPTCSQNHSLLHFWQRSLLSLFNMFAKNYILNSHQRQYDSTNRKILKLSSQK